MVEGTNPVDKIKFVCIVRITDKQVLLAHVNDESRYITMVE